MLHILALITAKPGQRDTVLTAFREVIPTVLAEDGCIEYGAAVDADGFGRMQTPVGPDTFVVIEKWASPQALAAHAASPHMAAYAAKTKEFLVSRVLHILSPV